MRTITLIFLLVILSNLSHAQERDTIFLTHKRMADTIFGGVKTKASTGFLQNRLLMADTSSVSFNSRLFQDDSTLSVNADLIFALIDELNMMSTSRVNDNFSKLSVFNSVSKYVSEQEFEKEIYIYPIGIIDYNYNLLDVESAIGAGVIGKENNILQDLDSSNFDQTITERSALIGPLFDYHDSEIMGLIFRKKDFFSNNKTVADVEKIELLINGQWIALDWDKPYFYKPGSENIIEFKVKLTYKNGDQLKNKFHLQIPMKSPEDVNLIVFEWLGEALDSDDADCGSNSWDPGCKSCGIISENGKSIKWCFIPSCTLDGYTNTTPIKPYILVAGWRPPLFGQSFKKTWKIYTEEHGDLLNNINRNNYDIILIKFNIHTNPDEHGMAESAELLEKFLIYLNDIWKTNNEHENVIHGSSMGSDIIRLTLLNMEKKHLANNAYSHHHCRLNIAHDGNFYGANVPFSYQCQILSAFNQPAGFPIFTNTVPNGYGYLDVRVFLETMLYSTMLQKSYQELLLYNPLANAPLSLWENATAFDLSFNASTHPRRLDFYNKLLEVDNELHIFPMPLSTRNIATSLGKISGFNSTNDPQFKNAGDKWHNFNIGIFKFKLGVAKYMPAGQTYQIFKRQKIGITYHPLAFGVKHIVNVSQMQEIDNCSGSYLTGLGNLVAVCDWTYFPISQVWNGRDYFAHKSVLTALGINENLWPANGSHSLNMQSLGLMYTSWSNVTNDLKSNHFGYPHLGRPTDHYQVTPFDAIYVDNEIDPHIKLGDATAANRDAINSFFLNEIEPWYLGLQNQKLGSQARANYTYRAYRIARNIISVGYHVTPTTPDGDYTTEPNAVLNLRAGDLIELKAGTHFKPGSEVHLKIEYFPCTD